MKNKEVSQNVTDSFKKFYTSYETCVNLSEALKYWKTHLNAQWTCAAMGDHLRLIREQCRENKLIDRPVQEGSRNFDWC